MSAPERKLSLTWHGFLQYSKFWGNYSNWSPTNLCQDVQMTDGGCWTIPWQTLGSIGPDPGEYQIILSNVYVVTPEF